jgi:ornithine cyclodeaminase/alanine dehydrogenase-like protein (mu-crystallin family)
VLALAGDVLLGLAEPARLVDAIADAMAAVRAGEAQVPHREHLESGASTLLVMPSAGGGLFGAKLVTLTPGNAARGLAVTQGAMLLLDDSSGEALAILDAAALTCQRTGAVAALGVRTLAPGIDTLGVVGCGVQGAWSAIMAAGVAPIRTLACVARGEGSFTRFSETVRRFRPDLDIHRCAGVEEMLALASCVLTATTSTTPVLPDDEAALGGKILIGVGAYRPHMQELPDAAYRLASQVLVDSPAAAQEAGDLIGPLSRGLIAQDDVVLLADVLAGRQVLKPAPVRIFKSVGYAAFDLFAARLFLQAARDRGLGQEVRL